MVKTRGHVSLSAPCAVLQRFTRTITSLSLQLNLLNCLNKMTCFLLCRSYSRFAPLQSLIAENEWPQKCLPGCSRGHPRSVCGSNGRLYKSSCAFQRAQCVNPQLRAVPRSGCTDPLKSKCQSARSQALESRALSDTVAVFVPECNADGSFLQVQCHNQTGYCWCSTPDGKPVSRTTVMDFRPNCTGEPSPLKAERMVKEFRLSLIEKCNHLLEICQCYVIFFLTSVF
uniref:SPARC related modular calcium binding 1 n=1 Tax=Denticeps clupeoides TaxID=299321 RepID=A0AAY4DNG6_9TELE